VIRSAVRARTLWLVPPSLVVLGDALLVGVLVGATLLRLALVGGVLPVPPTVGVDVDAMVVLVSQAR